MAEFISFSHTCPIPIWGLTSVSRIERVLLIRGLRRLEQPLDTLKDNDSVLILRGDYLFDDRLIIYLKNCPNIILKTDDEQQTVVAVHIPGHLAEQALSIIAGKTAADLLPQDMIQTPATLPISFHEKLLKSEPPFVLPITAENKQDLEKRLFYWSYKGITDLVTKWAWPTPARWAVGQCVRLNIRPNHVTLCSLVLVILAGFLFAYGQYGWGLLAGWLMTFLDTVDGKLARVTLTSSTFGHYFDHIIDLIHPPVWYVLWGLGLTAVQSADLDFSLSTLSSLLVAGYIVGRLVEGSFNWILGGSFGVFCWRPLDAYFRLITARRNPNMLILTLSMLAGRPELGFLGVTFWTVASSIFLLGRFLSAVYVRFSQGPLQSWLVDVDSPEYNTSLAVRLFTRQQIK